MEGSVKIDGCLNASTSLVRQRFALDAIGIRVDSALLSGVEKQQTCSDRYPELPLTAWAFTEESNGLRQRANELFNPLAAMDLGVALFVGVPLRIPTGSEIGSMVALNKKPLAFDSDAFRELKRWAEALSQVIGAHAIGI